MAPISITNPICSSLAPRSIGSFVVAALLIGGCGGGPEADLASSGETMGDIGSSGPADGDGSEGSGAEPDPSEPSPEPGPAGYCGDGLVQAPEQCDDGLNDGGPHSCLLDCSAPARWCGDGLIHPALGEQCDPGEAGPEQAGDCNAWCQHSGSVVASVRGPDVIGPSRLAVTNAGTVAVVTQTAERPVMWTAQSDRSGALTLDEQAHLDASRQIGALATAGEHSVALAGAAQSRDHQLQVVDTRGPLTLVTNWHAQLPLGGNLQTAVSDLAWVGPQLWMVGERTAAHQDVDHWIHRFDGELSALDSHVETSPTPDRSNAKLAQDPATGLAVVARNEVEGVRVSLYDPRTGSEVASMVEPEYRGVTDVCITPGGDALAMVSDGPAPDDGTGHHYALGFRFSAGEIERTAARFLGSGDSALEGCVTGEDLVVLYGQLDGNGAAMAVRDPFDPSELEWIASELGSTPAEAVSDAVYRDGRFYLAVGPQAGVVVLAQ